MKVSTRFAGARGPLVMGLVTVSALMLSGCMGSPRYGTDKTANEQLIEDLTGVLSIGPKKQPQIAYQPRPELVKPETTAVLPPPQDSVTTASAWPESPEQRRARLRQEATENQDNPAYRSPIVVSGQDPGGAANSVTRAQQEEFRRRMAIQNAADPTSRRYLSEPPGEYRQAAATAPAGELGEDEWKKERAARSAARKSSGKRSWWPW